MVFPPIHLILAVVGVLLLVGALSNKLSSHFNVPILLIFLGIGMVCGRNFFPEMPHFQLINYAGTTAMCYILFSGGLDTRFRNIRKVLTPGALLATVGVILTMLFFALFSYGTLYLVELSKGEKITALSFGSCLLLAALISSTDAASVFAILSGRKVSLKGRLRPLLELESGSNDPMAYFLTILVIGLVTGKNEFSVLTVLDLIYRMGAGVLLGYAFGWLGSLLFKIKLEYEGLYFVFDIALVILTYGITELLHANGMMACYVCGITLTYLGFNYQKNITRFSDGVSWLMQVILFTALGFFVSFSDLSRMLPYGVILSILLMFLARPLAVYLTLIGSPFSMREKLLISWVGLRGAAPIVLATFPLAAGLGDGHRIFTMIFIMVLVSMLIQGSTIMPLAKLLKLDLPFMDQERIPLELEATPATARHRMYEFTVQENNVLTGKRIADVDFPPGVLITLIRRQDQLIPPNGNTQIMTGDTLLIMASHKNMDKVAEEFFPESGYTPHIEPTNPTQFFKRSKRL